MKVLIAIQARSNSTRFPGKVFEKIGPRSLLQWVYGAGKDAQASLEKSNIKTEVCVIGPPHDDRLRMYCNDNLINSEFPPLVNENDLVLRYLKVAERKEATHVVRLTADCLQMQADLIVEGVTFAIKESADYLSNTISRSFIEGLDIQICTLRALQWFDQNQKELREHPFYPFERNEMIREEFAKQGFKLIELIDPKAAWTIKTSIDSQEDVERARLLFKEIRDAKQKAHKRVEGKIKEHSSAGDVRDSV